ncbi:MAG: ATP-binding cassette domain-containing protein, partial [Pseudomonadota bacterium]
VAADGRLALTRTEQAPPVRVERAGRSVDVLPLRPGKKLSLKWPGPRAPARALSGGNQQKLLLGRALIAQSRLWVLDEPTRGIDIAAKVDIYELIGRMAAEGKAVLIISSDLPELFGITDRILVMRRGRLVADLVTSETTREAVMQHAAVDKDRT